jgi:hypothetical protein
MTHLSGLPLRWLEDYQSCLEGEMGPWWEARAERAIEDGPGTWQSWRDVRQSEVPPCMVPSGHVYRPTGSALACVHCGDSIPEERDESLMSILTASSAARWADKGGKL